MIGIRRISRAADRAVLTILKIMTMVAFALVTLIISANVFVRFVPVASLHWFDEIVELLYAYLVFYGAAALWISREHFGVGDWNQKRQNASWVSNGDRGLWDMLCRHLFLLLPTAHRFGSGRDKCLCHPQKRSLFLPPWFRRHPHCVFHTKHRPRDDRSSKGGPASR